MGLEVSRQRDCLSPIRDMSISPSGRAARGQPATLPSRHHGHAIAEASDFIGRGRTASRSQAGIDVRRRRKLSRARISRHRAT